tara:strand:- start:3300 stop:3458 length:159 start_codon:yes stop_codon:yes gene_type:complete
MGSFFPIVDSNIKKFLINKTNFSPENKHADYRYTKVDMHYIATTSNNIKKVD